MPDYGMQGYCSCPLTKVQPQSGVILVMQAAQLYYRHLLHHIKGSSKLANSHLVDVGKASQCMFCGYQRLCPCLSLPARPGDLPEENFLLLHHSPEKQASPSFQMNRLRRLASMLHVDLVKLYCDMTTHELIKEQPVESPSDAWTRNELPDSYDL
jgi:hypothetical protein